MATITEDYVSFETAKLLKEKGFDEMCQKVYMYNGQLLWAQNFMDGESFVDNKCIGAVADYYDWITYTQGEYAYLCPTIQMVMKWLREIHKIQLWTEPYEHEKGQYNAYVRIKWFIHQWQGVGYKSNEEACEDAIKYCLENLI